ncbi:aspartic peptidase domain-containing protein [Gloeopeniophorella convolvens]|nr:aspartic peptidase domain-containing protein [Gloeopeniophorella convolvens]
MHFEALPITLLMALFAMADNAAAVPAPAGRFSSRGLHIPILRRAAAQRNDAEWGLWAKQQKELLEGKYGRAANEKRSAGYNLLVNQNIDSSYFGTIAVGTPATAYNVILDTGSADLWLADSACSQGCDNLSTYDSSASSSYDNLGKSFAITYGSGQANGGLATEVVEMAGFRVANQVLGLCDEVSSGLLNAPVSGLMGLAWQSLSASGSTPFWQSLFEGGVWDEPLMAFHLTRFLNESNTQELEPGGIFTMGTTNTSLYTGEIDYQSVPSDAVVYWTLPMTSLLVNSNAVSLPSGSASYAAIDTGTTLIGGPSDQVSALYAQIPGAQAGSACLGAIFSFQGSSSAPAWIVGDTFLKNVYAVFRAQPPSVGFAALAADAQSLDTAAGVPTPTLGAVSASVTGSGRAHSSGAAPHAFVPALAHLACVLGAALWYLF